MKGKNLIFAIMAILLCVMSCNRENDDDGSIFNNNLLKGISPKLKHYRKNRAFTVTETEIGPNDPKPFPGTWYTAANDDISIAFWPDYAKGYVSEESYDYYIKFYEVRQKTDKYFLGRFIGMTRDELLDIYPNPSIDDDVPYGDNYIIYYSEDKTRLINFWMVDNVVNQAAFAYSLD
jgi:hypothetical protein